jgi:hypothetical protein
LFLLDRSQSMEQKLGGSTRRKCDELASAVNNWLHNMAIRASSDDGIRDWLDVGVIGYRTTKELKPAIAPALQGPLAGRPLVSITDIGNHPARIETSTEQFRDEASGEMLEMASDTPVWIDPEAQGSTPMCHVLQYARQVLTGWIAAHPDSFPPMVIHITDGESQDGSPLKYAAAVRELATSDGNVLLFNCHLSAAEAEPFVFPAAEPHGADPLAGVLYQMSSPLPEPFFRSAVAEGMTLEPGARGMAFNADMVVLVNFLDMGTRAAANMR